MTEKILCVDDDPRMLAAFRRQLRQRFELAIALGGAEALDAVRHRGPFAVVLADLRMPGMDGIQLLSEVKELAPDTVRMMLTGNADLRAAVDAVNEGSVFRFLIKPCRPELLARSLDDGVAQYRLVTAEKQLLQETLTGCVKVLTEILSMTNPTAFSRTSRIKQLVRQVAEELELPNLWQFELAAMLSLIGCVALPPSVIEKGFARGPLTREEQEMFASHPSIAARLLARIPRLEPIARMIEGQQRQLGGEHHVSDVRELDTVTLGSQILRIALALDQLIISGLSSDALRAALRKRGNEFAPGVLAALDSVVAAQLEPESAAPGELEGEEVDVLRLRVGMVALQDIRTQNGHLLLPKGQELTVAALARVRNYARGVGVEEPIRVRQAEGGERDESAEADLAA